MTDEAMIAAIVEACGWEARHDESRCNGEWFTHCDACGRQGHGNCNGNGRGAIQVKCGVYTSCCDQAMPPDYLNDLNAMHEAEKVLGTWAQRHAYSEWLHKLTVTSCRPECATARQRAEAFLRTIGKWEDTAE